MFVLPALVVRGQADLGTLTSLLGELQLTAPAVALDGSWHPVVLLS